MARSSKESSQGAASTERAEASLLSAPSSSERKSVRDLRVTIEYRHLKLYGPGGVYVVPSYDDLRVWHGVIFLRRGLYAGGIFRFTVNLPPEYNDVGVRPSIHFTTPVFSPLVDFETGEVAMRIGFPEWDPARHHMIHALTFLKRIFYFRDLDNPAGFVATQPLRNKQGGSSGGASAAAAASLARAGGNGASLPNPAALELFKRDRAAYMQRVHECAKASQDLVYENPPGSSLRLTEPKPGHETLREKILADAERDAAGGAAAATAAARTTAAVALAEAGGRGDGMREQQQLREAQASAGAENR